MRHEVRSLVTCCFELSVSRQLFRGRDRIPFRVCVCVCVCHSMHDFMCRPVNRSCSRGLPCCAIALWPAAGNDLILSLRHVYFSSLISSHASRWGNELSPRHFLRTQLYL